MITIVGLYGWDGFVSLGCSGGSRQWDRGNFFCFFYGSTSSPISSYFLDPKVVIQHLPFWAEVSVCMWSTGRYASNEAGWWWHLGFCVSSTTLLTISLYTPIWHGIDGHFIIALPVIDGLGNVLVLLHVGGCMVDRLSRADPTLKLLSGFHRCHISRKLYLETTAYNASKSSCGSIINSSDPFLSLFMRSFQAAAASRHGNSGTQL
jgi:hypothetical protein